MSPSNPNHVERQATSFKQTNSNTSLYKCPVSPTFLKNYFKSNRENLFNKHFYSTYVAQALGSS